MVDRLIEHKKQSSTSDFKIESDNIFCKNGVFHEVGLIEHIAQTAALRAGYIAKLENKKIKKGFIGAVKRLKIYNLPKVKSILTTTITEKNLVMNAAIIEGLVYLEDYLVATCEMTIFTEE